jgi:glycosyltransferase 2 family protein
VIPVLGYAVSVAALVWVYWGFDWKTELPRIARADWRWVAVSVFADLATYFCQGWRWQLLLKPIAPARYLRSVQAVFVGLFANEVLPLRSGELIRAYVMARWTAIPFSVALSSAVVERLFDGVLLALGFYAVTLFIEAPSYLGDAGLILTVLVAVLSVMVAVVMFHKHHAHAAVARSRWAKALWHVVEALHLMGNSRWFLASAVVSALYLGLQIIPIYALARAYDLDLSLGATAVVLVILRLGTVIPQAPSNIGGFQFFAVVGLSLFGVDKDSATGFATIMFFVVTVPLWLGGAIATAMAGIRIKDMQSHAQASLRTGV